MRDPLLQALCCTCGNLRTCRRPRNHRRENRWLLGPVDRDWAREVGDLKCDVCERATTHAIITGDNHAEKIREAATGWQFKCLTPKDHQRIQERWRQSRPENPYIRHMWWISAEKKAREAGETHFQAICKATIPVLDQSPEALNSWSRDELAAPSRFHDVDREDPATGLYWFDVDCVDCLSRSNAIALEYQRRELAEKLKSLVDKIAALDARTVGELLRQFQDAESEPQ